MSVELRRLVADLKTQGHEKGAKDLLRFTCFLEKNGLIPTSLAARKTPVKEEVALKKQSPHPEKVLLPLRKGPYLEKSTLIEIHYQPKISYSLEQYTERALESIEENGDQSIYHLCLPIRQVNFLSRADVKTIDELRERFRNGKIHSIRGLGKSSELNIKQSLEKFDQEVARRENFKDKK